MSIPVERWSSQAAPNALELRRRMEAEGYSVTKHNDSPGSTYDPHEHDRDQTIWIISGSAQFRVGDEIYTLNAGDRDYLPVHTEHAAEAVGEEMVVYLVGEK